MKIDIEIRRHGQCCDYDRDRLTLEGKGGAKKLAERICDFDKILSAPSGRAIQTTEILSKGKGIEISPFLDEIPEMDREEEFNPETARRCAEKALKLVYNKILEGNTELLVITSGGLLGAIELCLKGKPPKTEDDLRLFSPLEGIRLSIEIRIIS